MKAMPSARMPSVGDVHTYGVGQCIKRNYELDQKYVQSSKKSRH